MDTVSISGTYGLEGQGLVFEGTIVTASFQFGDFPLPFSFQAPATYDWTIGARTVRTGGADFSAAYSYYTTVQADVGHQIAVTATVPYRGTHVVTSTRALTVVNVNDLPQGTVRIEGDTRTAGSVLSAVSTLTDEDGMGALGYEWRVDGRPIVDATGATYTLGQFEAGKTITVVASYVDGFGQAESVASDANPNAVHVNTPGKVLVTGTPAPGQTLRAAVFDPDQASKVYYQWQLDDGAAGTPGVSNYRNIEGAWSADYTVGATAPAQLRVLVTYADRFGVVESHAIAIGTQGGDVLRGDAQYETILALGGNDTIRYGGRGDLVDGGEGLDTFITPHYRYLFHKTPGGPGEWAMHDIIDISEGTYLTNIERVLFSNGGEGVALDYHGHAGQAYRLYQAAFDRTPDKVGQGFWMNRLDIGVDLRDIAGAFVASGEFRQLYGASPSNAEIVDKFYQHVLHRAPDPASQFWVDVLDRKAATVAEVLVGFSESAENVAALVGVANTGIDFTPYLGG